jgi:hypothetical protein
MIEAGYFGADRSPRIPVTPHLCVSVVLIYL